jgi:hypothetical protein
LNPADGGFLRVGDEAVDGFLTVDVGLVLEVAADGVAGGLQQEVGDGCHEEERDEAGAGGERIERLRMRTSLSPTLANKASQEWGTGHFFLNQRISFCDAPAFAAAPH